LPVTGRAQVLPNQDLTQWSRGQDLTQIASKTQNRRPFTFEPSIALLFLRESLANWICEHLQHHENETSVSLYVSAEIIKGRNIRQRRMTVHIKARHALIIEDEILIAFEVEALLAEQGFTSFDIAESPQDALAMAMARTPDLITADYRIIGGTGVEAVEAIHKQLGAIPVVYVTGNSDLLLGREPPVVGKPISPRRLAEACARAFSS
jgi:CheY-like chemotaxis protein